MDDGQLKKILNDAPVPPVDENAQKIAVNLALAEFAAAQADERNNISQGSSLWGRLTGRSHMKRRDPMNKKIVYGGMATAMVAVLAVGVTFQQGLMGTTSMTSQASINQMQFFEFDRSQTAGASARVESDQLAAAMHGRASEQQVIASVDEKPLERWRKIQDAPRQAANEASAPQRADVPDGRLALPESVPVQEMEMLTVEEAEELLDVDAVPNASDDGLVYGYVLDFSDHASPATAAKLRAKYGSTWVEVPSWFFDRIDS